MKQSRMGLLKPISQLRSKYESVFEANQNEKVSQSIQKLGEVLVGLKDKISQSHEPTSPRSRQKQSILSNLNDYVVVQQHVQQTELRFTQMKFNLQKVGKEQPEKRREHMKIFSSQIARKIMSKAFYWFEAGKITEKQLRQFFCNNFIANIVKYSVLNQLDKQQLNQLDQHLRRYVFSFLKKRYPQNQTRSHNVKFQNLITPVDNIESNQNDLVRTSGVKFKWKASKDYSKEIMQFINYVINLTREPNAEDKNLFQLFTQDMTKIFRKVENEKWMLNAQKKIFEQQQGFSLRNVAKDTVKNITSVNNIDKNIFQGLRDPNTIKPNQFESRRTEHDQLRQQKYKKQVKQYTKFAINQKIPENVQKYSPKQIDEQNLTTNNPSIMRIITKWCQELQKCFQQVNINSRSERFVMEDGSQRYIKKADREQLYTEIKDQQYNIQKFIKQIKQNIYENQAQTLSDRRCSQTFMLTVSEDQGTAGYFATLMKKSYENYLINYLNQLIHSILSAQEKLKGKFNKKQHYKIAVNLISFKVGDLLRCKCSSKQTQIIALYQYLNFYSKLHPDIFEIVRLKNRLTEGTKDILINMLYRKKLLVQVQLSINSDTSNFIKCSDKANHFIYQLQRATFGPLSEICNVYMSVDPRADYFIKQFQSINGKGLPPKDNSKHTQKHLASTRETSFPLWCDYCMKFVYSLNIVEKHRRCQNCEYTKCCFCIIKDGQSKKIKKSSKKLIYHEEIKPNSKFIRKILKVINLESKKKNQNLVYEVYFNFKLLFFEKRGKKKFIFFGEASKSSQLDKLFYNKKIDDQQLILNQQEYMQDQLQIHHQIVKLMIKNVNKKLKKYFVFEQLKINENVFKQTKMDSVQNVYLNNVQIQSVSSLVTAFPHAKYALILKNNICNLQDIQNWVQLRQLNLQGNKLNYFPTQIRKLQNLQLLNISANKFTNFPTQICFIPNIKALNFKQNAYKQLPKQIGNLVVLANLRLSNNQVISIPKQIAKMVSLIEIDMCHNKIKQIPKQLGDLQNIQELNFQDNLIQKLDADIFNKMSQIKKISFSNNKKISQIPKSLAGKQHLVTVDFQKNSIQQVPSFIFELKNIEQLLLSFNKIKKVNISKQPACKKLQSLYMYDNSIVELPQQIFSIVSIQKINIGKNKFKELPPQILLLENIKWLFLNDFGFKQFPTSVIKLKNIEVLSLNNNQISSIPEQIKQINQNLIQIQIGGNKFTKFPQQLYCFKKLEVLNVGNNPMTQLPDNFGEFPEMERLKLEGLSLKKLPQSISRLQKLFSVLITEQKIEDKNSIKKLAQCNSKVKKQWKDIKKKAEAKQKKNKLKMQSQQNYQSTKDQQLNKKASNQ